MSLMDKDILTICYGLLYFFNDVLFWPIKFIGILLFAIGVILGTIGTFMSLPHILFKDRIKRMEEE